MNIEPRGINGKVKEYLKKGAINIWQHQVVYLLPLLILLPTIGVFSMAPSYIRNLIFLFIGMFFIFLYMEITLTTTQEKYTPKKYLTSFIIAGYTMASYIKRHLVLITTFVLVLFVMEFIFDIIFNNLISENVTQYSLTKQIMAGILKYAHTNSLVVIACLSFLTKEMISDFFVVERMTGLKNETPEKLLKNSMALNSKFLNNIYWLTFIFNITAYLMLGFQVFFFIILIVAITFHSMDVFDIDRGKKQKQTELEINDMKNLVPTMNNV